VQSRQRDKAVLKLVANPKDPVKLHAAFDGYTTNATIPGQQRPASAFSNGEGERVSRRELFSFTSHCRGSRQFDQCELLDSQSERNEPIPQRTSEFPAE